MLPRDTRLRGAAVRAALFHALFLLTLTALGSLVAAAQPGEPDPRALLRRMLSAEQRRAYQAREITYIVAGGRQSEQIIKRDPKRGQRTEYVRPEGDVMIDNYKRSWFYSPRQSRMIERESRLESLRRMTRDTLEAIEKGQLQAKWDGSDTIVGRDADIVRVSAAPSVKAPARRFWVDRETGIRLKTEEIAPQGRILSSSYFVSLDLSPRFESGDFKEPKPVAGMRVEREKRESFSSVDKAQKSVKFTIRKPSNLPAGFSLRTITVMEFRDKKLVVQRFANGLNLLTLFQTDADVPLNGLRRMGGHDQDKMLPSRGPRIHAWRADGISYALLGNLPEEQMKSVASSMR